MANGTFLHDTPLANDIVYGEFKIYHNYGTPKQVLAGVTRGGLLVEMPRTLKYVDPDNVYGPQLDEDGVPMIRTLDFKPKLIVQMMYLKYFNIKAISDAEADDNWESNDWGGTGGTYTAETTIFQTGIQSAKCAADTDGYGIHNVFDSAIDLTAYSNGETSTTADKISFGIYISSQDLTDLSTNSIRLIAHMDSEGTTTNYYYYDVSYSALTADQWNNFTIAKSSFTETGTGDWSAVTGISFIVNGTPSAEVVFYVDTISMLMTITDKSDTFAAPIEGQGGNWTYTNETDYKKYTPKIAIESNDYLHNTTVIGTKHDGKKMKIIATNTLNDGNVNLAMGAKDEVVSQTEYCAHYEGSKGTTVPIDIYEYTA